MYSFSRNPDVDVVDEPLYGHYLRVTGAPHPGREDVVAAMDCDGNAVMQSLIERPLAQPDRRLFVKHMAHHLVDIDLAFLDRTRNLFLVRDPREMLPSLTVQVPDAALRDTGYRRQWELFERLTDAGEAPVVIDSRELLLDPAGILAEICSQIGVAYTDAMLSWPPGPIAEDGVWAPHWYHAVHKSTGFAPYVAKTGFPDALVPLLEDCQPWYARLYEHALRARSTGVES